MQTFELLFTYNLLITISRVYLPPLSDARIPVLEALLGWLVIWREVPAIFLGRLEGPGEFTEGSSNAFRHPIPLPPRLRLLPGEVKVQSLIDMKADCPSKVPFPGLTPHPLLEPHPVLEKGPFNVKIFSRRKGRRHQLAVNCGR
jgi:hypothetical protein